MLQSHVIILCGFTTTLQLVIAYIRLLIRAALRTRYKQHVQQSCLFAVRLSDRLLKRHCGFFLDMGRPNISPAAEDELDFYRKHSSRIDTHSACSVVWSDWPDLADLCVRTGVTPHWVRSDSRTVIVSSDITADHLIPTVTVNFI